MLNMSKIVNDRAEARALIVQMREALAWYAKQAKDCRKITSEGSIAREALDADYGDKAAKPLTAADAWLKANP